MDDDRQLDLRQYLALSRRVSLSLVYVAPLMLGYEVAFRLVDPSVQNSVEASVKRLLWYLGPGALYFHLFLLLVVAVALGRVIEQRLPALRAFPAFLVESTLLAALLGPLITWFGDTLPVVGKATAGTSVRLSEAILSSVSAGLYEEFVFRLLLLGGTYLILHRVLRIGPTVAFAVAAIASAVAFAGYHHIGPYGEVWETQVFLFRFAAGVFLGVVFAVRGLAVVVYLHAIYDVLLDLRTAGWPLDPA